MSLSSDHRLHKFYNYVYFVTDIKIKTAEIILTGHRKTKKAYRLYCCSANMLVTCELDDYFFA